VDDRRDELIFPPNQILSDTTGKPLLCERIVPHIVSGSTFEKVRGLSQECVHRRFLVGRRMMRLNPMCRYDG
jgi:hypothetical protein